MAKTERKSRLSRQAEDFGEEVKELGERFGDRMERRGRAFEDRMEGRVRHFGHRHFWGCDCCGGGSLWSASLSMIFGIVFLALGVWILRFLAEKTAISLLGVTAAFLTDNFGVLVVFVVLSGVLKFFSGYGRLSRRIFWPISFGLGMAVFAWMASSIVLLSTTPARHGAIYSFAQLVSYNLWGILVFFTFIGYFGVLVGMLVDRSRGERDWAESPGREPMARKSRNVSEESPIKGKRLYRSGRERILGGVCGGIAEYLGIDPTIVRLFWVLATLVWGVGFVLYIILWVIVPRNPRDTWRR